MKRQFCLPCFLELKKAGKHDITRIAGGKNLKITCWRCKRRRYGAEYLWGDALGAAVASLFRAKLDAAEISEEEKAKAAEG